MNHYNFIFLLLLIPMLVLANCRQEQNERDKPSPSTDSLASTSPQVPSPLPPNSALITGNVESVDTMDKEELHVTFKIATISKYGPATKPLSENEQLNLTIDSSFLNKKNINISSGDSLKLVISQSMTLDQKKTNSTWRIVDFK